ncbi:hypothetical protein [Methylomicrobium lacus]|uniref:hypothetical protein n=1 Tax=Methylomicrobium lacus TaxID=136992 RepID=UPI00045EB326|nr:hypothetical protein [Methylomicrobium lacus]
MAYTEDQAAHLLLEERNIARELQELMLQTVFQGNSAADARVKEHLLHGAARRIRVLRRSIENVFYLFPPSAQCPLPRMDLDDVQINLHAFVINLSGIFDNWAWAYVLRHNLEAKIGGRMKVGLFLESTRRYLPSELRECLSSKESSGWHGDYLKSFRDALAHRIPLYVPPAQFTPAERERYSRLESEKVECIRAMNWARLEEIDREQPAIGAPCFTFLHSFAEDAAPTMLYLHPQILTDARSVVEVGVLFLKHWHEGP